ncbi:MAG: acyl-CoA thioesterase [Saprospiraceae bacterium]|nr:acyl-CoA thioesterase [Saprospiraceae bacterium]
MINPNWLSILTSKAIIRFQHCDPFGHLNNSIYIDYLLNAREDQLKLHYGVDLYAYAVETGKAWVVASHLIRYLRPVKTMQEVTIESQVRNFDVKSLDVWFEMKDEHRIYCTMDTNFVHIDLSSGQPTNHSEEWMERFSTICTADKEV